MHDYLMGLKLLMNDHGGPNIIPFCLFDGVVDLVVLLSNVLFPQGFRFLSSLAFQSFSFLNLGDLFGRLEQREILVYRGWM
jgi:hypothetical protein